MTELDTRRQNAKEINGQIQAAAAHLLGEAEKLALQTGKVESAKAAAMAKTTGTMPSRFMGQLPSSEGKAVLEALVQLITEYSGNSNTRPHDNNGLGFQQQFHNLGQSDTVECQHERREDAMVEKSQVEDGEEKESENSPVSSTFAPGQAQAQKAADQFQQLLGNAISPTQSCVPGASGG